MELTLSVRTNLNELKTLMTQLDIETYNRPCPLLDNASIGKHIRHIIELFTCLQNQYELGYVNYDVRERNSELETNPSKAITAIDSVIASLDKPDKHLLMKARTDLVHTSEIGTNYFRELMYNLEHSIHHQALIKVALKSFNSIVFPEHFGYAPSTLVYLDQTKNQTSS